MQTVSESELPEARVSRLDNPLLVAIVYLASLGVLLLGELLSVYEYGDPRFVVDYFGTEVLVAALFVLATVALFPAGRIGLRRPELADGRKVIPLSIVLGVALAGWIIARLTVTDGA